MKPNYPESALLFAEWSDNTSNHIGAVLLNRPDGRMIIVGTIHRRCDPYANQAIYCADDTDGKDICPPKSSLYQLKKGILRREEDIKIDEHLRELDRIRLQKKQKQPRTR